MLEGYMFGSATPWWHVRRISNRHGENAPQTFVAHAVRTGELCGTGNRYVLGTAGQT